MDDLNKLIEAVTFIATHTRIESCSKYPNEHNLVNGVRHFLSKTKKNIDWSEEIFTIEDMIDKGMFIREIASHYKVNFFTILKVLKKYKIKAAHGKEKWAKIEEKNLQYYHAQGLNAKEIAEKLNKSIESVHTKIHTLGLKYTDEQMKIIQKRKGGRKKTK